MKRFLIIVLGATIIAALGAPAALGTDRAPSGSSAVIPLGLAIDHGRLVQGFAFVHGRGLGRLDASFVKGGVAARPAKPPKEPQLYTFLAQGAKWRTPEPYVVNPGNGDGAKPASVMAAVEAATATWEAEVTTEVFAQGSATSHTLKADWVSPDGSNEAYFSQTELGARTVAVTIVWGVFTGPPSAREIIEWDLVLNDALAEPWGDATVQRGSWDVQNIATHELGHASGLGDLYTLAAAEQTMYGYASPGETKKRSLESGDIAGIRALYR